MIALYSLPGSRSFAYRPGVTRAEGWAWIWAQRGKYPTQADLQAYRQSTVVSNVDGLAMRWGNGSRIVAPRDDWDEIRALQDSR